MKFGASDRNKKSASSAESVGKKSWKHGSFTTAKGVPNDIDGCWEINGVKEENLHLLDESFWNFSSAEESQICRENILKEYSLDFFIAEQKEKSTNKPFPDFFQTNKNGEAKGIIQINL